ncbi:type I DNA topoisomerase [Riemerella anatipestifer]|uniref:type I DNA topoisomerase n=1 Tax=Riemerella anatipestifer TaxID=34085 RepID=UPI0021A70111|nr:type I DNA topoisomerase [Riemerella anatipestifer]MCT6745076.1 type I DNA topoisomerase [Riemerella anatipestifer]MCU7572332.1 type I DNA topoisomerase [Riemerella anatipestifer]MCU7603708.1 type I DNA topoisomerase [Riemerella anatipestifer]MDY3370352.1 type I DNA topoisomerase [Riemerella anatipestifer]MDY3388257.1 type I DNA topoisomerase [Riemerella anatipestifer]
MPKNLVIVESPAKAKTIQKYLGKDFEVLSSFGHIRDLPKKGMGINLNTFTPEYEVSTDKKKLVSDLKAAAKKADMVWLASDEDREGEAIAWHLAQELKLKDEKIKRIVFHEITKNAILKAIENPRNIDKNLVNAQQARRVLDRIVGFEMSPILWKKVKMGLSAGRVQSVAVRLIVEKEKEIQDFVPNSYYKTEGKFLNADNQEILAQLKKSFFEEAEAKEFLTLVKNTAFKVLNIEKKPGKRTASAPFTTSTLQQEASNRLGYGVTTTMRIAQRLYEEGYITYMRTDSVNLSQEAIEGAKEQIIKEFGQEYSEPRNYATKSSSAQEAHEAIRPTDFKLKTVAGDAQLNRLYQLIYKRTLASQMANAQIEKTVVEIGNPKLPYNFEAQGEVIVFDGFLKVYGILKSEEEDAEDTEKTLPKVSVGESLTYQNIISVQKFTRPPARYTEAGLVKKLEELGIGRPSTYAPTIQTIQNREYVDKKEIAPQEREVIKLNLTSNKIDRKVLTENYGGDKNKFVPTDIGIVVNDFLTKNFAEVLDYGFTAKVEQDFDDIANGDEKWKEVLSGFYEKFHDKIEDVEENADRANGERILGEDPKTGKTVLVRIGRYGAMAQLGDSDDDNPIYSSLLSHQNINTITLEEALDLFKVPFDLEKVDGKTVSVGVGRFGPYVKWGETYISIPKEEDPLTVNQKRAEELIREKQKADAPITTFKGEPVTKGTGHFGPFLKYKNIFVNVPKKYDFENLSQDDIVELIEAKLEKEANRYIKQWEKEGISIENGRWGPFIKFNKTNFRIPKNGDEKYTAEELKEVPLEEIKKWIVAQDKNAFAEKKTTKKKTVTKKK